MNTSNAPGADAAFQAGVAALRDGRTQDAEGHFQRVVAADENHAAAFYNLGVLHYQADQAEEAEPLLQRAVQLRPSHIGTRSVLAAVSIALKKIEAAVTHADVIIQSESTDPQSETADAAALHSAGQVMALAGRTDDAAHAYRRALAVEPTYRLPALALVSQLLSQRAFREALTVCESALVHRPKDQDLHLRRAQALWESGQTAAAKDALENLVDFAPDHMTALYNLSLFAGQADPQTAIDRLSILLAEDDLSPSDAVKAWFALGNLYATQNKYEEAMASFEKGNARRQDFATPTHAQSAAAFEKRAEAVTASPLPEVRSDNALSGPTPLIIAGPSRSGKSLLQAWLSAHPEIAAADEVGVLPKLAEQDLFRDADAKAQAAETYRSALAKLGGPGRYVIDTHPTNALYLDLLLDLCPDAKVIQVDRDPLDLALSTFFRNFVTGGHWADTWGGIATRLRCYDQLRAHWRDWSPVVANLRYEDVVRDPARALKQVIGQLGLEWDDALAPPAGPQELEDIEPVPWASFADRPVARSGSVGLWKPFATWLAPFADAYGRDTLADAGAIPAAEVHPMSSFSTSLRALKSRATLTENDVRALQHIPAYHSAQAQGAEASGRWSDALAARWTAVSCRPFTSHTSKHTAALMETVQQSPQHRDLAALHEDLSQRWAAYRESSGMRFGDYGLFYQSCAPAFIAGSRDTDVRADAYGLKAHCMGKRVLDLGCNTGFLALAAAQHAEAVTGVEKETALVEIGQQVASHLEVRNCDLQRGDAATYQPDSPFDLVIAAAVHGWIDLPITELGHRLVQLTAPHGAVLFESQGQRSTNSIEAGFHDKVMSLTEAGFQVERDGQICDDRVNLRAFVVLRKG